MAGHRVFFPVCKCGIPIVVAVVETFVFIYSLPGQCTRFPFVSIVSFFPPPPPPDFNRMEVFRSNVCDTHSTQNIHGVFLLFIQNFEQKKISHVIFEFSCVCVHIEFILYMMSSKAREKDEITRQKGKERASKDVGTNNLCMILWLKIRKNDKKLHSTQREINNKSSSKKHRAESACSVYVYRKREIATKSCDHSIWFLFLFFRCCALFTRILWFTVLISKRNE